MFKRYVIEDGTEKLDDIFKQGGTYYISDITIIEVISNIKRKNAITKELDDYTCSKIKSAFFNDIAQGMLNTYGILSETIIKAVDILDNKYLTPLDSIQLAAALQLESEKENVIFVVSDKKLCSFAEECGLECLTI